MNKKSTRVHTLDIETKILPKSKRSQAAMEFLMTYGWAILAAVIAIGVLAYFGVFSPGKYMPESCIISQPFGCEESSASASATDAVKMVIRNGLGDEARIHSLNITSGTTILCSMNYPALSLPMKIADGTTAAINLTCSPTLISGRLKGDLQVSYIKGTGTLQQTASGSITKKIP